MADTDWHYHGGFMSDKANVKEAAKVEGELEKALEKGDDVKLQAALEHADKVPTQLVKVYKENADGTKTVTEVHLDALAQHKQLGWHEVPKA